jgi:hypothetical protein
MEPNKYGVHRTHCCAIHGCKYGDEDCPVASGTIKQEYSCEWCNDEGFENAERVQQYVTYQQKIKEAKENGESQLSVDVDFLDFVLNRKH